MKQEIKDEFKTLVEALNKFMDKINRNGKYTCDFYYGVDTDFMRLQEINDETNEEVESFDVSASKSWSE